MRTGVAFFAFILFAGLASAEVAPITRELAAKVLDTAEKAKRQHSASPNDAAYQFIADFNGEFGDISPVDSRLLERPDLVVTFLTPIQLLRSMLSIALQKLMPLPSADDLVNSTVVITVSPKQRGAPSVQRLVLFRGENEVKPVKDDLAPQAFSTAAGASFTINAGSVTFALDAFKSGSAVKIVLITDKGTFEKTIPADDVSRLK